MLRPKVMSILFLPWLVIGLCLIGCSSSTTSSTSDAVQVDLPAFDELVSTVAPPVFTVTPPAPSSLSPAVPDTSYAYWALGQQPLLGKVFGETEPQALYRNVRKLGTTVLSMNRIRRLGDTTITDLSTDSGTSAGSLTVKKLTGEGVSVGIPTACRGVLGSAPLQLQYQVDEQLTEQTQTRTRVGFRQNDTCDVMLAFHCCPAPDSLHPEAFEYSLTYAYRNRLRDSAEIRAVHFRAYNDSAGKSAMWAYHFASKSDGTFRYRMSWLADDFADTCGIGCIVGSGNHQVEFAFRYQQLMPPDRLEPDPLDPYGQLERVFGANYSDQGATLASGWDEATDPANMFRYQHMPIELRYNSGLIEGAFDPWAQD